MSAKKPSQDENETPAGLALEYYEAAEELFSV